MCRLLVVGNIQLWFLVRFCLYWLKINSIKTSKLFIICTFFCVHAMLVLSNCGMIYVLELQLYFHFSDFIFYYFLRDWVCFQFFITGIIAVDNHHVLNCTPHGQHIFLFEHHVRLFFFQRILSFASQKLYWLEAD